MYEVWYNTPVRLYVVHSGDYEDCLLYTKENKENLKGWGYFYTIRLNGIAVKRIG